ncbi:hypothetical protein [Nannocystis pusilla]|uniref:hypothetical protein n=1 Tax=Nannocystis pusilla TaxID=889268 RepID=UPI003BEF8551
MRIVSSPFITRAAGLLLGGLSLVACDPKILLGEFGDTESSGSGESEGQNSDVGTEGQSSGGSQGSGGTEGQSTNATEGQSSSGGSGESQSGTGQTGETGETGETGTTTEGDTGEPACDPWAQDCPVGQKCAPYDVDPDGPSWDSWRCVDLDPTPEEIGHPCHVTGDINSGQDDCEVGAMCWDVDPDTDEGTCVSLCLGSPQAPTCAAGSHCAVLNDGGLNVCLPDCDPLLQNCAGADLCIPLPNTDSFVCVLDASGAEGQEFDACEFANACDKGLICADPSSASECDPMATGCCIPFCDVTDPSFCQGVDQECLPWFAPMQAPPGYQNVGVCGLP